MFSDEQFTKTVLELENPDTNGWEFFVESHGVTIYRLYNKDSGLYQYKVYGTLAGVPAETCAEVYRDIEYRNKWDGYVNELTRISETEDGVETIYWHINFPFFMSNRDYLYLRQFRELQDSRGEKVGVCLAKATTLPSVGEKKGVIRVTDYLQSCALTSDGKGGTKAYMHYYDDPKGSIPKMLINWGAKTGVPGFLTDMEKACKGYDEYLKNKHQ